MHIWRGVDNGLCHDRTGHENGREVCKPTPFLLLFREPLPSPPPFPSATMDSSLSILGAIAFVLFHALVSLPLATLTARQIAVPWMRAQGVPDRDAPEWAVVVGLLVLMSAAFALRGHVIAASGARHAAHA